jgi:hypothetical protein
MLVKKENVTLDTNVCHIRNPARQLPKSANGCKSSVLGKYHG